MLNRFDDFFSDPVYLDLKNHLFNYMARCRSIQKAAGDCPGIRLEIGSGISPVTDASIYTDLSFQAMNALNNNNGNKSKSFAVTNACSVAFQENSVDQIVLSEVLEHIKEDDLVLSQLYYSLKPGGNLILTVPTQSYYYAYDDKFVEHERRYQIPELIEKVEKAGFTVVEKKKIGGPLEKLGTWLTVKIFVSIFGKQKSDTPSSSERFKKILPLYKAINHCLSALVRFDAWLMPQGLTSIILLQCKK